MARAAPPALSGPRKIRCAIYTRKSSEEGLEQEFNSLDAQHEACTAYIASQKHEGWTQVPDRYDDGGYSGGSMERPGLKRLLADTQAGKVDVIVVYKVDRLTRALSDFARIVEVLDGQGASFVSVTQAFNTTTSMGRLTLNVLLSFAQFEREVTGERIRDKIAASKRKGMWMGGPVSMGYEVQDRKLVINEQEAQTVRHIFNRYLELGSGQKLVEELRRDGYRTRIRKQGDRLIGGIPFETGPLFTMLANRLYIGEITHKCQTYPGEHEPIIDRELWDAVQAHIAVNRTGSRTRYGSQQISLLAGILTDGHGRRMSPSHTSKGGKRYRYYITHGSGMREGDPAAWRVPAKDLEAAVVEQLCVLLSDRRAIYELTVKSGADAQQTSAAIDTARTLADRMDTPQRLRSTFVALVASVRLEQQQIVVGIDVPTLSRWIGLEEPDPPYELIVAAPAIRIRSGMETKLVLTTEQGTATVADPKLISLLDEAYRVRDAVLEAPDQTLADLARKTGQCRKRLTRLLRVSWLAPDIVQRIVQGRHPAGLTAYALMSADLPSPWAEQRALLAVA